MNKRLREATEPIEVTQPFKRNRPVEMQTITLFMGAHGSDPDITKEVKLRSSNPHLYDDGFTVNFLSFAGFANIKTIVALVFVREPEKEQEKIIKKIEQSSYDTKYKLFDSVVAKQLNGLGTDRVALSYLVPRIFKDKIIDTQSESISVIDDMKNEMWALGMLADIDYSKPSPPVIVPNPPFEKWWWFDNNLGDDLRRFDTKKRTGIARAAGNREDNPILATNGLFILHTTNDEHSPFSISNIKDREYADENGLRIITSDAIKRRNLLRKINYTSYWKKWIEAFDFSGVPDDDVLKIGSIEEAVFIVKQIYYAFRSKNATDDPAELDGVDEYEEEYTKTGEEVEEPVAECKLPALSLSLSQTIINQLNTRILPQADKATSLNILIKRANEDVQTQRDTFFRAAEAADELEKQINEQTRQRQLRSDTPQIAVLTEELALADKKLEGLRGELTKAMNHAAELNSELDKSKGIIGAGVTEFIRHLISQPVPEEVKAAIKNIIMRNKLKNILKFGIFHKRLSLSQVILFFRSLGYNIINIVDPSCFVPKAPRPLETDIDSQILSGSQEDIVEPKRPPLDWCEELTMLVGLLEGDVPMPSASTASANGIAKREKNKGSLKSLSLSRKSLSRKSLSRHRMSSRTGGTTQRRRRRQKRQNF
jgi:hypothetical protein